MHYVLVHNGYVVDGPKQWNYLAMQARLQDEYDIEVTLPKDDPDGVLVLSENTVIYPSRYVPTENFEPLFHNLAGPFWVYTETEAIGSFNVLEKPLDESKSHLKKIVASNRYDLEVSGVSTSINGVMLTVDTSRSGRQMFINQLVLMGDNDTIEWKFPEAWVVLSKSDMIAAVSAGATHVKTAFEWEGMKASEIDACTTIAELQGIDLVHISKKSV